MSDKKLFIDRRWHEPPKVEVIGHREISEEDRKNTKRFREYLRKIEVLKHDNKDEE
ncbi:hypothetical protein [Clostridium paraputrificum]|uniref:hypothetical protein n=1 Tax=Clostridium paraputrificum TaxID=29363 RepID=UPI00374F019F